MFSLPNQIHSNNDKEFINQLWKELFQELKILHTYQYTTIQSIIKYSGEMALNYKWEFWEPWEESCRMNGIWVGERVWVFEIIPGSCDKLRSYWNWTLQNCQENSSSSSGSNGSVQARKTPVGQHNCIKEFRGDNGVHGLSSDPSHSEVLETNRCS